MMRRSFHYLLRCCLVSLYTAGAVASAQSMRVHLIDVGQGAATLLEFSCGAVLVDAGGETNTLFDSKHALIEYLDDFFATRPDLNRTLQAFYLSHAHIDHTRGAAAVLERYRVRNAITNGFETGSGRFGQIAVHRRVAAAEESATTLDDIGLATVWTKDISDRAGLRDPIIDPVACAGVDPAISVLWGRVDQPSGWKPEAFANQNNHSIVVRVSFGKSTLLLAGDLEEEGIEAMVKKFADSKLLDVDVLQATHHGSHNGTAATLLDAASPNIAVIQMGRVEREMIFTAWAYGHPRKALMDRLQASVRKTREPTSVMVASGAKQFSAYQVTKAVYGTGWDGTLVLEADAHGNWTVLGDAQQQPKLVDLNTATIEELQTLPMIGPARAAAILRLRHQRGRIRRIDDLTLIPGIKKGTIRAIRHLVVTP